MQVKRSSWSPRSRNSSKSRKAHDAIRPILYALISEVEVLLESSPPRDLESSQAQTANRPFNQLDEVCTD